MNSSAITPLLPIPGPGQNFSSASRRGEKPVAESDALKAARQFEALFIKQLLSEVKISASMGGEEEGAQSDFVDSMWRDQLSKQISQKGLGLAQVIAGQLGGGQIRPNSASGFQLNDRVMAPNAAANSNAASPGLQLYQNLLPQSPNFSDPGDFVRTLKPYVQKAAEELGVSPKILMAQAALETGWGQHMPVDAQGRSSNNLFGIKAHGAWSGDVAQATTQEFDGQAMRTEQAGFRSYNGIAHGVDDYVQFLKSNPRYQDALQHGGSDKNFVLGLKFAGYATDPQYVEKVISVADSDRLAQYWDAI
ncbi:MAG: flagellar assembly peptidoglycan hydrolase FlgJ [Oceanococcus sp.]